MYPQEQDTHSGLLRKLERDVKAPVGARQLVDACCRLYEAQDVIRADVALRLDTACHDCHDCWSEVPQSARPEEGQAEISVPWVGASYLGTRRRVCVIGMNQNAYGGLGAHWWIARGAIQDLRTGHGGRRRFHRGVGRYLATLYRAVDGLPLDEPMTDYEFADAWETCSFVEAVKCSPTEKAGKPSPAMWGHCPPRFLTEEVRILEPTVIFALGHLTWEAVKLLGPWDGSDYGDHFWRAQQTVAGRRVEVFFVNHPSHEAWKESLPELQRSLERQAPS